MTEKVCGTCKARKPASEFYVNKSRLDGLQTSCKPCKAEYNRNHYKKNADDYKASANRHRQPPWRRHRLTEDRYGELLAKHDGLCHVCITEKAAVIDHDHACCPGQHSCGECVRGVLCGACNRALGLFRDNIEVMARAIQYLR